MSDDADELSQALNLPDEIMIGFTTIKLTPIELGELPLFLQVSEPIFNKLRMFKSGGSYDWYALMASHSSHMIRMLEVMSRKPRSYIDSLQIDDAMNLFTALIAVNADFFARRVVPALTVSMLEVTTLMKKYAVNVRPDGPSSSTSLGETPTQEAATASAPTSTAGPQSSAS